MSRSLYVNEPFPSCFEPHFENEAKGLFTWRDEDPSTWEILEGKTTFRLLYMLNLISAEVVTK